MKKIYWYVIIGIIAVGFFVIPVSNGNTGYALVKGLVVNSSS